MPNPTAEGGCRSLLLTKWISTQRGGRTLELDQQKHSFIVESLHRPTTCCPGRSIQYAAKMQAMEPARVEYHKGACVKAVCRRYHNPQGCHPCWTRHSQAVKCRLQLKHDCKGQNLTCISTTPNNMLIQQDWKLSLQN